MSLNEYRFNVSMSRGKSRQEMKIKALSYIISRFGYTTKYHFTEILGLKSRSQDRFIKSLIDKGYIRLFEFTAHHHPLILPRKMFVDLMAEQHPESKIPASAPKKISESLIRHTLFSQKILATDFKASDDYITDRMMDSGFAKRPDIIINKQHAIEAELSYKGKARTTKAFLNLLMAIKKGEYEKATYYTQNNYIYSQLLKTFNSKTWTIPQNKGKALEKVISEEIKSKINFIFLTP